METPIFTSSVHYQDPKAALAWLERAFGFEVTMAIEGPPEAPHMCHYEMSVDGRGRVMIGGQWEERLKSPRSLGGSNTQGVHVLLEGDLDAHCKRARAAGASITAEPATQFYGDRTYRTADLEGHQWTFAVHVRDVSRAEAEAALGQPITRQELAVSAQAKRIDGARSPRSPIPRDVGRSSCSRAIHAARASSPAPSGSPPRR